MDWIPVTGVRINGNKLQLRVTDRAYRYRAVRNAPAGQKRCAFCGAGPRTTPLMVGHVNGHEEDGDPRNLIWTCRSCNGRTGNALKRARLGRRTRQYNPGTAPRGARSLGQWMTAVMSMRGESDAMSVRDAVEMVRATSAAKRAEYASQIWERRRQRGTDRWGGELPF